MKKVLIIMCTLIALLSITACSNKGPIVEQKEDEKVEIIMPKKGQVIKLGNSEYRVISIDDSIAKVIDLNNYGYLANNGENNIYENSPLDKLLNEEYYNDLADDVKNAIIEKEINVNGYVLDFEEETDNHTSDARYNSKTPVETLNRKVYALDLEDIEDYFNNVFTGEDIQNFFNSTQAIIWLRSSTLDYPDSMWGINSQRGYIMSYALINSMDVRASFMIDLNKVSFEIVE